MSAIRDWWIKRRYLKAYKRMYDAFGTPDYEDRVKDFQCLFEKYGVPKA